MSQENVERTRRVIEAFNQRDLQGYLELMAPESGVHPIRGLP